MDTKSKLDTLDQPFGYASTAELMMALGKSVDESLDIHNHLENMVKNTQKPTTMKLYTEEQVRKVISESMFYHDTVDSHISKLTPIELPSDEEIEKEANERVLVENIFVQGISAHYLSEGAKWVVGKIKKQQ